MWVVIVLLLALCPAFACADPPPFVEVSSAEYRVSASQSPPVTGDWKPIDLPYAPRGFTPERLGDVTWFRFRVPSLNLRSEQSLYIWRHNVSAEVFLGNDRIGGMRPDGKLFGAIGWNYPILVHVPTHEWRAESYFYVRLVGETYGSMLSTVLVGDTEALTPLYSERLFWQVETSKWSFSITSLMGVFVLWLWSRRRQDKMYLWFAGACFSWSIVTLYLFLDVLPLPLAWWLSVIHTALDIMTYCLVSFMVAAEETPRPRFRRSLLGVVALASLLHFVYPHDQFFLIAYTFHAVCLGFFMYLGAAYLRDTIRNPGNTSTWFTCAFAVMLAFWLHDWYYFMSSPKADWVRASNTLQLGVPAMLVILLVHLVNRFVTALDEAQALNENLEARVEAHRLALEESFNRNRLMEIEQTAAREREKIYRDLHDDVGSRLVSIVHSADESRVSNLARSALESLREAIYRAHYQEQALGTFVDAIEEEARIRVETAGKQLAWRQSGLHTDPILPSDVCYHVTRMAREVMTNILHHSHAAVIDVHVDVTRDAIRCTIRDDGSGFDPDHAQGNGIRNVRYRASQIGATAEWQSAPGEGTTVTLLFPRHCLRPEARTADPYSAAAN
ncbi:MAG: hypothetical protein KDI19_10195 [Pseudomonadales bacterium]|nr:hypothetical protein [Pseudomonadales bacterium]